MRCSRTLPPRTWDLRGESGGSAHAHALDRGGWAGGKKKERGEDGTVENGAIGGEEAILETLSVVAGLEGVLLEDDVGNFVAGEEGNLVAAMAVEDAKEGELVLGRVGGSTIGGSVDFGAGADEVEQGRVGILHADTPTLHGGHAVCESVILALVGRLAQEVSS